MGRFYKKYSFIGLLFVLGSLCGCTSDRIIDNSLQVANCKELSSRLTLGEILGNGLSFRIFVPDDHFSCSHWVHIISEDRLDERVIPLEFYSMVIGDLKPFQNYELTLVESGEKEPISFDQLEYFSWPIHEIVSEVIPSSIPYAQNSSLFFLTSDKLVVVDAKFQISKFDTVVQPVGHGAYAALKNGSKTRFPLESGSVLDLADDFNLSNIAGLDNYDLDNGLTRWFYSQEGTEYALLASATSHNSLDIYVDGSFVGKITDITNYTAPVQAKNNELIISVNHSILAGEYYYVISADDLHRHNGASGQAQFNPNTGNYLLFDTTNVTLLDENNEIEYSYPLTGEYYWDFGALPNGQYIAIGTGIEVYNGLDKTSHFLGSRPGLRSVVVANIDGIPGYEYIGVDSEGLFVFSEVSSKVIWSFTLSRQFSSPALYYNSNSEKWLLATQGPGGLYLLETLINSETDIVWGQDQSYSGSVIAR